LLPTPLAINHLITDIISDFQQDIQKRLSLPADLRLPIAVIEKLNRTPTLDQPLTRKSRRASLVSFFVVSGG
jgi:hypothetical protein